MTTFESNIVFVLRFMIDTKVVGMNWIEVPAGKYKITPENKKRSSCQLEISFRSVFVYVNLFTSEQYLDTMHLYLMLPRATGPRSHHYEFLVSILNALVGRVFSQRRLLIRSSKLPTWLQDKVS